MTKFIKPAFFAVCLIAFGSAYARIGYAVGSYYLDAKKNDRSYNDNKSYSTNYSQSEVYASAQQSKKKNKNTYDDAEVNMYSDASKTSSKKTTTNGNSNITSNSYVVEGGEGGKKIYNTIIVKTNKNTKKQSKAVKTTNKKTKQKQVIVEEEATDEEEPVKVVKKKRTKKVREDYDKEPMRPEERAQLDEEQIEENKKTEEEIDEEELASETKKKRKKHNRDTTPASWYIYALGGYSMTIPFWSSFETNYANVDTKDKFPTAHGYHFAIGAKFYSWHFFFSPEFLYQRFDTNIYKNSLDTKHSIHRIYWLGNEGYEDISAKTKTTVDISNMIVGGVRIGFTIGNSVSIYGRGNVGLINVKVRSATTFDNYYRQLYGDYETAQMDKIEANTYSKDNWNMIYGLGGGLEFALLRQHIFFRLEYDYYWLVKSSITLPYKDAKGNDKLTYKGNFGTILFSVGLAF